ncbi:MAG: hypothetical protein JXM69_18290 [Anaerolineae bacterium]|nr:hypothetical protein [Anaerolineae bacterium]
MIKIEDIGLRIIVSLILLAGLLILPTPAFSQQDTHLQNLIINGNFADGFQEFGVGYGWGAFSNGQAAVGWNADTWDKVIPTGQTSAQMIEIKDALERDRYAGIYQTVPVVPGQQYKLTIKGLIRSTEGDIGISDYGYRLQYGVDQNGDTAWELIDNEAWHELIWNEQPLFDPPDGTYRFDTYEATITAKSDQLTLFIRGWKKWINSGSGIFDIQEVSLVGPAPEGFAAPAVQAATVETSDQQSAAEFTAPGTTDQMATGNEEIAPMPEPDQVVPEADQPVKLLEAPGNLPPETETQLPVSGQGRDNTLNYVIIFSLALLLILFSGAITATIRRRKLTENTEGPSQGE